MSDTLGPMRANMRAFYRLLGERSPNGQVHLRARDVGAPPGLTDGERRSRSLPFSVAAVLVVG